MQVFYIANWLIYTIIIHILFELTTKNTHPCQLTLAFSVPFSALILTLKEFKLYSLVMINHVCFIL